MSNAKTVSLIAAVRIEAQQDLRKLYELYGRLDADVANLNAAIEQVRASIETLKRGTQSNG